MSNATYTLNRQGLQAPQFVGSPAAIATPSVSATISSVPAFQFSVLTNYKKLLTKTVFPDNRAQPCYAMNFKYSYHEVDTLEGFAKSLEWLAPEQHRCIIRGRLKPELNSSNWHRRLIKPSYNRYTDKIDQPTIECQKRRWIVIDIDGCRVPAGLGAPDKLAEAGYGIRDHILSSLFHGIRCVVTATTKTGLLRNDIAHLRMFFMLAEEADNDLLRVWLEKLNLEYPFIDPSVGDPEHIIYTARPVFIERSDPVPEWGRVRLLDGYDDVIAPELPRVRKSKREPKAATSPSVGGDVPEWMVPLAEQDAGAGVHELDTSAKAWRAIQRIFEMLDGCGVEPKVGERGRHRTLYKAGWELACLVAEGELTKELACQAYWKAAGGIVNSDGKYDTAAIQAQWDNACADIGGSRQ